MTQTNKQIQKKRNTWNVMTTMALYYNTIVELYGKEIADMIQKRVNEKARILNLKDEEPNP